MKPENKEALTLVKIIAYITAMMLGVSAFLYFSVWIAQRYLG